MTFYEKNVPDRHEAKAFRLEVVMPHPEGTKSARRNAFAAFRPTTADSIAKCVYVVAWRGGRR